MTKRIDGKARADRLVADVAAATAKLKAQSGITPGLCAVLVGEDPASQVYVRNKGKAAVAAGIASLQETLPATITEAEAEAFAKLATHEGKDAMTIASEFASTGRLEIHSLHGFVTGKICIADTTASAFVVLNKIEFVTVGDGPRMRPS